MVKPQLDLSRRGVHTQGRVTALTPENHSTVRYRFEADGTAYEGSWQSPSVVAVGDSIPVTYLPDQPQTSVAGEPRVDGWWFLPFVLLPGVATIAALTFVRVKPPNKTLQPTSSA